MQPIPDQPPAEVPGEIIITTTNAADTFRDLAERVVMTFITAVVSFWVTTDGLNMDLAESAATAGLVAAITVVSTFIRAATPQSFANPYVDVMVRMGWTFVQVAGGLAFAAGFNWGDFNSWQAAASAGIAAAITVLKGFLADRFVGGTLTPASVFKAKATEFANAA